MVGVVAYKKTIKVSYLKEFKIYNKKENSDNTLSHRYQSYEIFFCLYARIFIFFFFLTDLSLRPRTMFVHRRCLTNICWIRKYKNTCTSNAYKDWKEFIGKDLNPHSYVNNKTIRSSKIQPVLLFLFLQGCKKLNPSVQGNFWWLSVFISHPGVPRVLWDWSSLQT